MLDVSQAAELLHLNPKRVQDLARLGKLPASRVGRRWLFSRERLESMLAGPQQPGGRTTGGVPTAGRPTLAISARNRLRGRITRLRVDGLMAEVTLRIGDQELVSVITSSSVERMGLREGDEAFAVIKSTEVMVGREEVGS